MKNDMDKVMELVVGAKKVVAMTGAGVSTLCGIPDFRGPQGLYRQADAERIFDIDWFDRDPRIYYNGCRELVYGLKGYEPGPVHKALKKLEDDGRLIGCRTHEELLASCPVYREIHESQFGGEEEHHG